MIISLLNSCNNNIKENHLRNKLCIGLRLITFKNVFRPKFVLFVDYVLVSARVADWSIFAVMSLFMSIKGKS